MTPGEFWGKIDHGSEAGCCWLWTGARDARGYGRITMTIHGEHIQLAHRAAYLLTHGAIPGVIGNGPSGNKALDHLCRNPSCVNPAHLDPCGQSENSKRQVRPTQCPQGHPYDEANTKRRLNSQGYIQRVCRVCDKASQQRYRAKRRAA